MPAVKPVGSKSNGVQTRARVLVVDDEPGLVEVVSHAVEAMSCCVSVAASLGDARKVLAAEEIDVLVTDIHLPDGDGVTLVPLLQRRCPTASAIVMTGSPSVETAVAAMREGAIDFVAKPFDHQHLIERIGAALDRSTSAAKEQRKIERLRRAVRRLNEARRLISKKVDLLCNDLVGAYGELSRQVESVRAQETFRKALASAGDLEQLLCHTMDWLLRKIGYSNVALWLAGEDGAFQLGAYMKYTLPGDPPLTDAMRRALLPLAAREGRDDVHHARADDLGDHLNADEAALLEGQDLLTLHTTYLGESLAALVFFRDAAAPFTTEDETLMKAVGPVFALALANVVRGCEEEDDDGDEESEPFLDDADEAGGLIDCGDAASDDNAGPTEPGAAPDDPHGDATGSTGPKKPKRRPRRSPRDAADWWKRGETPPF